MVAPVDIVNSALRRLGGTRIVDINQTIQNADVARDIYDGLLEDTLRRHKWKFASKTVKLARLTEVPTFEFDYAYALPSDWLRNVEVSPDIEGVGHMVYRIEIVGNPGEEKRVLVSSEEDVYLRYVSFLENPNFWTADFKEAFTLILARELAIALTSSRSLRDQIRIDARSALGRAMSTDSQGSTPTQQPRGSWVTRRGSGRLSGSDIRTVS